MSNVHEAISNENSPEYNRAKKATMACIQLVIINIGLLRNGLPGKLYIDMIDSKDYISMSDIERIRKTLKTVTK